MKEFIKIVSIFLVLLLICIGNVGCAVANNKYAVAFSPFTIKGCLNVAPSPDGSSGAVSMPFQTGMPTATFDSHTTRRVVSQNSQVYLQPPTPPRGSDDTEGL